MLAKIVGRAHFYCTKYSDGMNEPPLPSNLLHRGCLDFSLNSLINVTVMSSSSSQIEVHDQLQAKLTQFFVLMKLYNLTTLFILSIFFSVHTCWPNFLHHVHGGYRVQTCSILHLSVNLQNKTVYCLNHGIKVSMKILITNKRGLQNADLLSLDTEQKDMWRAKRNAIIGSPSNKTICKKWNDSPIKD